MAKNRPGFTLLELLIVVTVVAILSMVAVPKFAGLLDKSKEGATKGHLGELRSATQLYYGENDGFYPVDNLASIVPKYLGSIPLAKTPGCAADSNLIHTGDSSSAVDGNGGWAYNNTKTDSEWGHVYVNCTGLDSTERYWTSF